VHAMRTLMSNAHYEKSVSPMEDDRLGLFQDMATAALGTSPSASRSTGPGVIVAACGPR
jgi:hypothetical protein